MCVKEERELAKCPACNRPLKFFKVIMLTNSSKLKCPGCGTDIKSDTARGSAFGAIGAASAFGLYKGIDEPINYAAVAFLFIVLSVVYYCWAPLQVCKSQ